MLLMFIRMSHEITLVLEVEKHECLFNYKLAEYCRKDVTDRAWGAVANKVGLTVNDCKEKWRNIRSSFLRSMKAPPSGSKTKKPYYLKDYMQFLLPYVKPLIQTENPGNIPAPEPQTITAVSTDTEDILTDHESENVDPNVDQLQNEAVQAHTEPGPTQSENPSADSRRRKRAIPEVEKTFIDYLKTKTKKRPDSVHHQCRNDNSEYTPMHHFLLSLLPEFTNMTEDQIRFFKIKVLQLIDNIKSNNARRRHSETPTNAPSESSEIFSIPSETYSEAYSELFKAITN